jgi:hypothetical protein
MVSTPVQPILVHYLALASFQERRIPTNPLILHIIQFSDCFEPNQALRISRVVNDLVGKFNNAIPGPYLLTQYTIEQSMVRFLKWVMSFGEQFRSDFRFLLLTRPSHASS